MLNYNLLKRFLQSEHDARQQCYQYCALHISMALKNHVTIKLGPTPLIYRKLNI